MMKTCFLLACLVALSVAQTTPQATTLSPLDPAYTGCEDINGDYVVDIADLARVLTGWGVSNCWNPQPTTKTYYMVAESSCVPGGASVTADTAIAVLRADRTQWSNVLSGTVAFSGSGDVTSVSVREVATNAIFLPLFGGGTTPLATNPYGFSVYMNDAQFDALTASPSDYVLYFGTTGAASDICAVFAEGSQPATTTGGATTSSAGATTTTTGTTTTAAGTTTTTGATTTTAAPIPPVVDFTASLNNAGLNLCDPFPFGDVGDRVATASLRMTAIRTQGVLEGYSLTGEIVFGGAVPNWPLQITSIRLTRVEPIPGFGPYTIASARQTGDVSIQALAFFISTGEDIINNSDKYRIDILTGTSTATFEDQSEICGNLIKLATTTTTTTTTTGTTTTGTGAATTTTTGATSSGATTTSSAVATTAAPTPLPVFEPRFLNVGLTNVQCTPSGPFQNGAIGGTVRTASASLLLTRTKAANVLSGSITFDVNAGETIPSWWNQVSKIELRHRTTRALLVSIFGTGGSSSIGYNPFDGLTVVLSDGQLFEIANNFESYTLVASSIGAPSGLVCGTITSTTIVAAGPSATTVPAPMLAPVPFTVTLDGACASTTSTATATANLNLFRTAPIASIQGQITFTPGTFTAEVGLIAIYRSSDDLLLLPLFSGGYDTITDSYIAINSQAEDDVMEALVTNPSAYHIGVITRAHESGKGEICGALAVQVPCECNCATTVPGTTVPATTAAATTPAPPFVAGDATYTVTMDPACDGATLGQTGASPASGSANIALTYAPNAAAPTQVTLSGTFTIPDVTYRATVTSVSIYRVAPGSSEPVPMLNLWSGAAGTLIQTRLFTLVVRPDLPFAQMFNEFPEQFYLGTSTEGMGLQLPINVCGQVTPVPGPPTTAAPSASPTVSPTAGPTGAPSPAPPPAPTAGPTASPTGAPTATLEDTFVTKLMATVTCNGGTSEFVFTLLQQVINDYQGTITGNASPLFQADDIDEVKIQATSGIVQEFTALAAPISGTSVAFGNGGFLSAAFSHSLRRFPSSFEMVMILKDGTVCQAPIVPGTFKK